MLPSLGPLEVLVILLVVVLVFPPHKLPELARNLGRGLHELQKMQRSLRADLDQLMDLGADSTADDGDAPDTPSADAGSTIPRDAEGDSATDEPPAPPRPRPPSLPGA